MGRYYDDELYHFGRLGQRWGRRNGPPYPLNSTGLAKFRRGLKNLGAQAESGLRYTAHKTKQALKSSASAIKSHHDERKLQKAAKKQEKENRKIDQLAKDPIHLWKEKDKYSNEQLERALQRINVEDRLYDVYKKRLDRPKEIVDKIVGYGQTANNVYNSYRNLFDDFQEIKTGRVDPKKAENKRARDKTLRDLALDPRKAYTLSPNMSNEEVSILAKRIKDLHTVKTGGEKEKKKKKDDD